MMDDIMNIMARSGRAIIWDDMTFWWIGILAVLCIAMEVVVGCCRFRRKGPRVIMFIVVNCIFSWESIGFGYLLLGPLLVLLFMPRCR